MLSHTNLVTAAARRVRAVHRGPSITELRDRALWQTNTEATGLRSTMLRQAGKGSKVGLEWPRSGVNWRSAGVGGVWVVRDRRREGRERATKRDGSMCGWNMDDKVVGKWEWGFFDSCQENNHIKPADWRKFFSVSWITNTHVHSLLVLQAYTYNLNRACTHTQQMLKTLSHIYTVLTHTQSFH